MRIHLNKTSNRKSGIRVKKKFLYVPVFHKHTVYWLEKVKLHYGWNGSKWVVIDIN